MQGLPKQSREPGEILGVEDQASLEDLRKAYVDARDKALRGTTLEKLSAEGREPSPLGDVEWAYKELLARFMTGAKATSAGDDEAVSAVLLPGIAPDALGEATPQGNVLLFSARKEAPPPRLDVRSDDEDYTVLPYFGIDTSFTGGEHASQDVGELDGIPELKEALARAAAPFPMTAPVFVPAAKSVAPTPAHVGAHVGARTGPRAWPRPGASLSAPLITKPPEFPADADTFPGGSPRTIRTVIGGEEREVVNIVAKASHRNDVQETIRGLLAGAEVLGGPLLKTLRMAMDVEVKEICSRTRMSVVQVEALEEDAFERLPAPVYYRGFVVSYLRYLGVERPDLADALTENYRARLRARATRGNR